MDETLLEPCCGRIEWLWALTIRAHTAQPHGYPPKKNQRKSLTLYHQETRLTSVSSNRWSL
jgi:hypothetical protein